MKRHYVASYLLLTVHKWNRYNTFVGLISLQNCLRHSKNSANSESGATLNTMLYRDILHTTVRFSWWKGLLMLRGRIFKLLFGRIPTISFLNGRSETNYGRFVRV